MRMSLRSRILLTLLCGIGFSMTPAHGHAATYVVFSEAQEVKIGEEFKIKIGIDTEGEKINLFKVNVMLPEGWELSESDTQDSIVNIWIEKPSFDQHTRALQLIGGVPGGFLGRGVLTSVTMRSPRAGEYAVQFTPDSEAYLNDGVGTLAPLTFREMKLNVKNREWLKLGGARLGMLSGGVVVFGVVLMFFLRFRRARSIHL